MDKRKPIIAGNWKMYKTVPESVVSAGKLAELVNDVTDVDILIAPTFTALAPVCEKIKGTPVAVGAQNLHWESEGAFTGEISADMIVSTGCSHVIIGHSERRQYFGETDDTVNKKIKAAISTKLIPVLCVGETKDERDADKTFSVLDKQIKKGLEGVLSGDLESLIVAYEPVWAIGTGKTADSDQAQEVHKYIRSLLSDMHGSLSENIRIQYGGSVKPDNVAELMAMPDIDGALVGGASLDPITFSKIIRF